ncbi:MAG: LytTR family DNA-binding domain-containing protein [Bacteroidetes bacterium]|nr:LytTR family DNA-binding domain-containing protein [Bacteroidota bacterium]
MIKAIIIEDETKAAELLSDMVGEIEPRIQIVDKCIDIPCAVKSIKKNTPDLVFLDVELPIYNGLQLLNFFNPDEIKFKIIFTTASHQHAIQAFDMSAVDYVLKPLQYDKLKSAIQKFIDNLGRGEQLAYGALKDNYFSNGNKKIVVPLMNGFEIIKLKDILFIKAEGSYSHIHQINGTSLMVSHNLKYYEDIFSGEINFLRAHRSYLVNINFVKRISRNDGALLVMENNTEIPVALDKIDSILNYFNFNKKNMGDSQN